MQRDVVSKRQRKSKKMHSKVICCTQLEQLRVDEQTFSAFSIRRRLFNVYREKFIQLKKKTIYNTQFLSCSTVDPDECVCVQKMGVVVTPCIHITQRQQMFKQD